MKNKTKLVVLAAASLLTLASCGANNNSSSSSPSSSGTSSSSSAGSSSSSSSSASSGSSSSSGSGSSSNSSTPVADTYLVVIHNITGVTVTSDKAKAKKGETVTLTIIIGAGYTLQTLKVNNSPLTVTDGKATFVMPDQDVDIYVTASVSGDITLGGGLAAALTKEGDLYVAKDVRVEKDSEFYLAVKGDSGYTPIAYGHLNRYKCFANVTFADNEFEDIDLPTGAILTDKAKKESLLKLAGNAIYDIYYDPSDTSEPIYIQRVGVITAPNSSESYESLFASRVYSDPATYPAGLSGVTYYDNRAGVDYSWQLYEGDSSLATIVDHDTKKVKSNVYKTIKDGVYTVVDNYIEGKQVTSPYPYSSGATKVYLDDSMSEDTSAYSGKYKIVDEVSETSRNKRYEISEKDAKFKINQGYSHGIYSIDRVQWSSYRDSFTIQDDLVAADNSAISSVVAADGSFTTTIHTYKTYDPTKSTSTSASYNTMSTQVHIEYNNVFKFTKAGAPLEGSIEEMMYESDTYDFDAKAFKAGGEGNGTLVKRVNFAYSYNDVKATAPVFDATPYFATSITAKVGADNVVKTGWRSTNTGDTALVVTPSPATALDGWQYGIIASSNENAIGFSSSYNCWLAPSSASGKTTLTIGNHVDTLVTTTLEVSIQATAVRSFYLTALTYGDDWHLVTANKIQLYAGTSWVGKLCTSPDAASLNDVTFEADKTGLVDISLDSTTGAITFDASKTTVSAATTINVTIHSPNYALNDDGTRWGSDSVITIVLGANQKTMTLKDMVGTWKVEASQDSSLPLEGDKTVLTFTDTEETIKTGATSATGYKASLVIDDTDIKLTVDFLFTFDENSGSVKVTYKKVTTAAEYDAYSMSFSIDDAASKIGVQLAAETWDFESGEATTTNILGGTETDEEGQTTNTYVFFVKVA